ncbi:MAG TPA: 16S rRNA (cytosine(1402)-N(4))-methyltransferase [Deltaproteobacteria bacterium]|nr:MAG: 16S rRNA (cytosine(1402)-N(4))-methyltransferase [Deltaproteobacteria bacterium GWA2_45_12]HBF11925.1 16S rRNA (cytosine(1402)-N(4))-methyltransferase [Deltaproteobacteria bacterium]
MHISVLLKETIQALQVRPDGVYLDATGGMGGHARELVQNLGKNGRLYVADADWRTVEKLEDIFKGDARVCVLHARFSELGALLQKKTMEPVDGLVADLGFSSFQLESAEYGFSFKETAPLDMRLDVRRERSALDLIDDLSAEELANLFYTLGEERYSRKIAVALKHDYLQGTIHSTADLRGLCERVLGRWYRGQKIHPATRVFQALRIAVNHEVQELEALLKALPSLLKKGGRAAIISFHSLEDRRVKIFFREMAKGDWKVITKKPVTPSEEEIGNNPRSRSAKLRIIERTF